MQKVTDELQPQGRSFYFFAVPVAYYLRVLWYKIDFFRCSIHMLAGVLTGYAYELLIEQGAKIC